RGEGAHLLDEGADFLSRERVFEGGHDPFAVVDGLSDLFVGVSGLPLGVGEVRDVGPFETLDALAVGAVALRALLLIDGGGALFLPFAVGGGGGGLRQCRDDEN